MRDIGKNIRDIRVSQNLTQDQLADLLFVTRQTVSNYENGRSRPDVEMVLRIAEVLETDVNNILYGVSVLKSKKASYKRLWIAVGIITGLIGIHVLASFLNEKDIFQYHSILVASKISILPIAVSLIGWVLMHILGMFCNLRQLSERAGKFCRIVLWVVAGFISAMLLPYVVFEVIAFIRHLTEDSVNMSLYIPVLNQIAFFIFRTTYKLPFLYAIFGGLFWLAGIPGYRK